MRFFPRKSRDQRAEQEIRLQPFTQLAAMLVAIIVVAGMTHTWVYSDTSDEFNIHALLSSVVALAAIALFGWTWKKEARKPFSIGARRVVWRAMFLCYLLLMPGLSLVAIFFHGSRTQHGEVILVVFVGLPVGRILYRLALTKEKSK